MTSSYNAAFRDEWLAAVMLHAKCSRDEWLAAVMLNSKCSRDEWLAAVMLHAKCSRYEWLAAVMLHAKCSRDEWLAAVMLHAKCTLAGMNDWHLLCWMVSVAEVNKKRYIWMSNERSRVWKSGKAYYTSSIEVARLYCEPKREGERLSRCPPPSWLKRRMVDSSSNTALSEAMLPPSVTFLFGGDAYGSAEPFVTNILELFLLN